MRDLMVRLRCHLCKATSKAQSMTVAKKLETFTFAILSLFYEAERRVAWLVVESLKISIF